MLTYKRGYWHQTKFPIHKVWWLRGVAQIGQTFTPLCESCLIRQRGRVPIGHRFIAKQKEN